MQILIFWLLFVGFIGAFAAQVARRVQLIAAAPGHFALPDPAGHLSVHGQLSVSAPRPFRRMSAASP